MFDTVGPVWNGNEVWLVVAAGATFAAFPAWYATMFSGFYLVLLVILVLLIVRAISFEWRERGDHPRWQATWRWPNTAASVGAPFLWGLARANLVGGVPLSSEGDISAMSAIASAPTPFLRGSPPCCCSPCTERRFCSRGSQSPRSSSRTRRPDGARWRTSVPPPAPLPTTIAS